tara:strand:+ start:664 stop:1236 length:573 start_codon:yes stop_codon:yes gene_type:complete
MSTNIKITIRGNEGLYTKKLVSEYVFAKNAVEAKEAVDWIAEGRTLDGVVYREEVKAQPAVEAKEAVQSKPAVWEYIPFNLEFETTDNSFGGSDGRRIFSDWLADTGSGALAEAFNIAVEKEVLSFSVKASLGHSGYISAEMADEYEITTEHEAYRFVEDHADQIDWEEDGDIESIEVDEEDTEYVDVEW